MNQRLGPRTSKMGRFRLRSLKILDSSRSTNFSKLRKVVKSYSLSNYRILRCQTRSAHFWLVNNQEVTFALVIPIICQRNARPLHYYNDQKKKSFLKILSFSWCVGCTVDHENVGVSWNAPPSDSVIGNTGGIYLVSQIFRLVLFYESVYSGSPFCIWKTSKVVQKRPLQEKPAFGPKNESLMDSSWIQ